LGSSRNKTKRSACDPKLRFTTTAANGRDGVVCRPEVLSLVEPLMNATLTFRGVPSNGTAVTFMCRLQQARVPSGLCQRTSSCVTWRDHTGSRQRIVAQTSDRRSEGLLHLREPAGRVGNREPRPSPTKHQDPAQGSQRWL